MRKQWGRQALAFLVILTLQLALPSVFAAGQELNDRGRAESEASSFLKGVDDADLADVYRLHAGPSFSSLPQDRFVEQFGIFRIQSGGPAISRALVGGQPFHHTPTGQQGDFFFFRYRTAFSSGMTVFQDVYLERSGAAWKISGVWLQPVPPGPAASSPAPVGSRQN